MAKIEFQTSGKVVQFEDGVETNLLATAIRNNAELPYKCGGGLCGTCKIHVEEGAENLTKIRKHETHRLTEEQLAQGYRLACMSFATADVKVTWDGNVKVKENAKLKAHWESK